MGPGATTRVLAACRSIEFDAVVVLGAPEPAPDARAVRDSKAAAPDGVTLDPRVALLLAEVLRHDKVVVAWGAGRDAVIAAGGDDATPGVVLGERPSAVLDELQALMGAHRVWERHPA